MFNSHHRWWSYMPWQHLTSLSFGHGLQKVSWFFDAEKSQFEKQKGHKICDVNKCGHITKKGVTNTKNPPSVMIKGQIAGSKRLQPSLWIQTWDAFTFPREASQGEMAKPEIRNRKDLNEVGLCIIGIIGIIFGKFGWLYIYISLIQYNVGLINIWIIIDYNWKGIHTLGLQLGYLNI